MKLTASKKDARCDYRLCVQENVLHSAQQKHFMNAINARLLPLHYVDKQNVYLNFILSLKFYFHFISIFLSAALRCDGMTAADGNIGPGYFEPHDIFHKTRKHFPLPRCPVCVRAPCARAGMFICNLPASRAPRCPAHRGSHPILLYHIML